jgi:predicted MPP superfamily phosphohydrolase
MWEQVMKYNFYVIRWGKTLNEKEDYGILMWDEAREKPNIHICNVPPLFRVGEGREFYNVYFNDKRFKKFFYQIYLYGTHIKRKNNNVVLINDVHPCLKDLDFIDYLKKKYNAIVVLYFQNQVQNKKHPAAYGVRLEKLKEKFDYIITDDHDDAKRYGLYYISVPYSKLDKKKQEINCDLYYTGWDKNRSVIAKRIAGYLTENGVKTNINLVRKDNRISKAENINYTGWKAYSDVIQEVQNANCLLELVEENQTATTLRYLEALCYNKKLLSNNVNIVNYKGYNPKYMKIFDKIEDIDVDFVTKREDVNYEYSGYFSPVKYLETVERIISGEIKPL